MLSGLFLFSSVAPSPCQTKSSDGTQKGIAAYNLGNYDEALQYFKTAIEDDPDAWSAYEQAGYCYYHLKRDHEMRAAFDSSLGLHPNNSGLKAFLAALPKEPTPTPARPPSLPHNSPGTPDSSGGMEVPSFRLNLSGSLGYGLLGDLSTAANYWNQELVKFHAQGNASLKQYGAQFGLEGGLDLNKLNGLSLEAGFETLHGFQEHLVYSSPISISINPQLFVFGLNYYRFFPSEGGRLFLTGGLLFGEAIVDFYQDDPLETLQGPLTGSNFGFTLGAGQEWNIAPSIGFQMLGRFRVLAVQQLQNNYLVSSTKTIGQAALAVDSQGAIGLVNSKGIGQSGYRYAALDYTGFTVGFSIDFHLF